MNFLRIHARHEYTEFIDPFWMFVLQCARTSLPWVANKEKTQFRVIGTYFPLFIAIRPGHDLIDIQASIGGWENTDKCRMRKIMSLTSPSNSPSWADPVRSYLASYHRSHVAWKSVELFTRSVYPFIIFAWVTTPILAAPIHPSWNGLFIIPKVSCALVLESMKLSRKLSSSNGNKRINISTSWCIERLVFSA